MPDPYFGFVASAFAASALALGALGLWTFLDARAVKRRLAALEAARSRSQRPEAAS